jgi:hypothetical protein
MLKNPFVIYILTFGGVLAAYQLGWSEIYPTTSLDLAAILVLTFVVALGLGLAVESAVDTIQDYRPGQMPWIVGAILLACFGADIWYDGSVPLIDMLQGQFKYTSFVGIPTLHVFAVTFGSAFATIRFADFLYEPRWLPRLRYLLEALVPIAFCILIVYRGPALVIAVSWAFVFIIKRLRFVTGAGITLLAIGGLYLFGVFGEARTGSIDALGRPTHAFLESGISKSYFAAYLYSTGPMANLQYAVTGTDPIYNIDRIPEFFVSEMLPDFISNRLLPLIGAERIAVPEISAGFNVSSIFGRSYLFFGWIGVLAMFGWFAVVILVYLGLILRSPYRVPCLALLNTLILFCMFDNMIAITSLSLQLAWPLLLAATQGVGSNSSDQTMLVAGVPADAII